MPNYLYKLVHVKDSSWGNINLYVIGMYKISSTTFCFCSTPKDWNVAPIFTFEPSELELVPLEQIHKLRLNNSIPADLYEYLIASF